MAALNKDTIKKTAPAFADLDPYWEELLHLCLSKNEPSLKQYEMLLAHYPSRFEPWFLCWAALYRRYKDKQEEVTGNPL